MQSQHLRTYSFRNSEYIHGDYRWLQKIIRGLPAQWKRIISPLWSYRRTPSFPGNSWEEGSLAEGFLLTELCHRQSWGQIWGSWWRGSYTAYKSVRYVCAYVCMCAYIEGKGECYEIYYLSRKKYLCCCKLDQDSKYWLLSWLLHEWKRDFSDTNQLIAGKFFFFPILSL